MKICSRFPAEKADEISSRRTKSFSTTADSYDYQPTCYRKRNVERSCNMFVIKKLNEKRLGKRNFQLKRHQSSNSSKPTRRSTRRKKHVRDERMSGTKLYMCIGQALIPISRI